MTDYRVVCPDDVVVDDHLDIAAAVDLVAYANRQHNGAICTGPHRIQRSLGWEDVLKLSECEACGAKVEPDDLRTVGASSLHDEVRACSKCAGVAA